MIYVIQILNNKFIKIGFSKYDDVSYRISELQTGNPYEIKPVFTTFGTLIQEKELHRSLLVAFTRIRIPIPPNEWYPGKAPMFQEFLGYLKYGPNAGMAFLDKYNQSIKQPGHGETSLYPTIRWPDK